MERKETKVSLFLFLNILQYFFLMIIFYWTTPKIVLPLTLRAFESTEPKIFDKLRVLIARVADKKDPNDDILEISERQIPQFVDVLKADIPRHGETIERIILRWYVKKKTIVVKDMKKKIIDPPLGVEKWFISKQLHSFSHQFILFYYYFSLLLSVSELPSKSGIYAALLGLLNEEHGKFVQELVEQCVKRMRRAIHYDKAIAAKLMVLSRLPRLSICFHGLIFFLASGLQKKKHIHKKLSFTVVFVCFRFRFRFLFFSFLF